MRKANREARRVMSGYSRRCREYLETCKPSSLLFILEAVARERLGRDVCREEMIWMFCQHVPAVLFIMRRMPEQMGGVLSNPVAVILDMMADRMPELKPTDAEIEAIQACIPVGGDLQDDAQIFMGYVLQDTSRSRKKNGVVFTPPEGVAFIVESVQNALGQEFGKTATDPDVHFLDPFAGTGAFAECLIRSAGPDVDVVSYELSPALAIVGSAIINAAYEETAKK